MESSCFICGKTVPTSYTLSRENTKKLKQSLTYICELLSITDINSSDWNFVSGLQQSICCSTCYDVLKDVGRIHEIIVKTQKKLTTFLDHVESLVVRSKTQDFYSSLWSPTCFAFRRRIIQKVIGTNENAQNDFLPQVLVKEERDIDLRNDYAYLEDSMDHCWDNAELDDFVEERLQTENILESINENRNFENKSLGVGSIPVKSESRDDNKVRHNDSSKKADFKNIPVSTESKTEIRTRQKRKIIIIVDEDEEPEPVPTKRRRTSNRAAKTHAEEILKQYAPSASDQEDCNSNLDKEYENEVSSKRTTAETEGSEDNNVNEEANNIDFTRKRKKKGNQPTKSARPYHPFIVAGENLYLYKWGSFARFNYTHLQCKAYNCTFETEFDYFSSFQVLKKHIDENHRSRNHRQKTPHPCLVCNNMFRCQEEFRKHIKTHDEFDANQARAICECCMTTIRHSYVRAHLFNHKNEEEKAAARAANDGSQRCFRPKESEIVEKKYVCDYENCTSSFKSNRNLRRHKQTHLPMELRTDQTICTECGQRMLRECLATHMKRVHHPEMVDRVSICPICDKRFLPGDQAMLQKHIRWHRDDKPFLCTECGKSYVGSAELAAHVNEVHTEHAPKKCQWCDLVYTRYRSLQSHMKRKHPDQYIKRPNLKMKSKFYYKEKDANAQVFGPIQRFPCYICETIFKYRCTLKKHLRTVHKLPVGGGGKDEVKRALRQSKVGGRKGATPKTHNGEGLYSSDVTTPFAHSTMQPNRSENLPGTSSMLFPIQNSQYFGFGH